MVGRAWSCYKKSRGRWWGEVLVGTGMDIVRGEGSCNMSSRFWICGEAVVVVFRSFIEYRQRKRVLKHDSVDRKGSIRAEFASRNYYFIYLKFKAIRANQHLLYLELARMNILRI